MKLSRALILSALGIPLKVTDIELEGTLTIGGNALIGSNYLIRPSSYGGIYIRDVADSDWRDIHGRYLYGYGLRGVAWNTVVKSRAFLGDKITFQNYQPMGSWTDVVRIINGEAQMPRMGDTTALAGKALDWRLGFFYPKRVSDNTAPTPASGELLMWHRPTTLQTFLMYNDPTEGVRQIELT